MKQSICAREMCECRTIRLRATTATKTIYLAVTVQEIPPDWQRTERVPHEVGDYLKGVGEYIDELLDRGHPSDEESCDLTGKP